MLAIPGYIYSQGAVEAWGIIRDGFEFQRTHTCTTKVCVHSTPEDQSTIFISRRGVLGEDVIKVSWRSGVLFVAAEESGMLDVSDWLRNFDVGNEQIFFKDVSLGVGYDGFVKTANATEKEVVTAMEELCQRNGQALSQVKVVYTGYSRGGGLVQVYAYAQIKGGFVKGENASLFTFGSPRALQAAEAEYLKQQLEGRAERYVHRGDPVPALPFSIMGLSYLHRDASQDKYRHVGKVYADDTDPEFPKFPKLWRVLDHLKYDDVISSQERANSATSRL